MLRLKSLLQSTNIILYFFISIVIFSFIYSNLNFKSKFNGNETLISGVLIEKKIDGNKLSLLVSSKEKIRCTYYIKNEKELEYIKSIDLGSTVLLEGNIMIPSNNTIPNNFNYKKYLFHKNIKYQMQVSNLNVIKENKNILYVLKNIIIKRINNYKSSSYLKTFILGDKSDLEEYLTYQRLGVSHLFAISGMHISFLSGVLLVLLKKINNNIKYPLIILFLSFYAFLTNYSASILRTIMLFIILYLNKEYDFNLDTLKCLYIALSILLIINPHIIYDIGFLYSSIISYALIKYNSLIKGNYLIKVFKISLIAFLFSLPITININYEINILSVLNNLLFVPLITFIIYPLSLLTFIFKPLDILFLNVISILEDLSNYLFVLNIIIPKLNIIHIIIYYIILYIFFNTYNKKMLLIIVFILIIHKYTYLLDNNYYVYYFDVSQGDSSLLKYKSNVSLIDTGGKVTYKREEWMKSHEYYYTDSIIKFMKSIGITKIKNLVITHGDYDHMGEAIHLVENFKVEKVILNCGEFNDLEKELIKVLDKKKIPYYSCIKELNINNNNKLHFLQTKEYDNENDNSNVIYTELSGYKFLFMGDSSSTTEKEITNKYNISNIDILKIGHHGSKTSSSEVFIDKINPRYSIISVGKNNRYGHPNKEVLDNLKESQIYRTDIDGSIMFKIKNNKLKIETCIP